MNQANMLMARARIDIVLLFTTRIARLFAYGFVSVVLVMYLTTVGLGTAQVGLLLTLTLVGDAVISLWLTTTADRLGRKRTLVIGAALMLGAGIGFVLTQIRCCSPWRRFSASSVPAATRSGRFSPSSRRH